MVASGMAAYFITLICGVNGIAVVDAKEADDKLG